MPRLEIEVTDQLMEKLQKNAEALAVEPADVAKSIISSALATREKPCWLDNLTTIITRMSEAVIVASKMGSGGAEPQKPA